VRRSSPDPKLSARRSLRWYPVKWRARYGDEFSALLAAEIAEQPRCLHRSVDVAAGGILARLADAGLAGVTIDRSGQPRRSLVTFGCSTAVFFAFAVSIWTQLNIAQQFSEPTAPVTHDAILIMTIALFGCLALAALGTAPIVWQAVVAVSHRRAPGLQRQALLFLTGTAVLVAGGVYFRGGWGGHGTHPWTHQPMSPGGPIALMWTSTLAVSAYWAHPTTLAGFPLSEIAWMILSPVALIATVTAAATMILRLDIPARALRFTNCIARVVTLVLGLFVFGTLTWLVDGGSGPNKLFQAGTVDQIGLGVMTTTLGLAALSAYRTSTNASLEIR
jgi:hypothetical protein